jgi:tripartite-type tricarboxylate transporter receptor subunit TctC
MTTHYRSMLSIGLVSFASLPVLGADAWPVKPVRIIVPFAPGGSNDIIGRLMGQQLTERLGKQVIVDNRPGAGGMVGTEAVVKSPPDGYTLLVVSAAYAYNPYIYKLPYDQEKALIPVAMLGTGRALSPSTPRSPRNRSRSSSRWRNRNPDSSTTLRPVPAAFST